MNKTVCHFIRKSSQLKASFIQNQIINHSEYKPVIIYKYHSAETEEGFAEFDNKTIPVLNLWESSGFISKYLYKFFKIISKKDVEKIENFIKEYNVDILHFHYGTDAGIFYPFIKNTNIPSVVSFYGYDAFSFPAIYWGYGKKYLHNRVFKNINLVLAMTEEMRNDLLKIKLNSNKIKIHYHGVPDNFSNYTREYKKNAKKINLLMLSYFDPVKGHLFTLQALKHLISDGVDCFQLLIAGDGHYKSVIQENIKKFKLNSFVKLIGAVKYKSYEYMKIFKQSDIFLHPSIITKDDKEGIPGAIVEAMLSGLPVISTYHGGIPYIIENNKTGLLVNEGDVNSLFTKIKILMGDSELRRSLGTNARNYALKNLLIEKKEVELEAIYDKLIGLETQLY